MANIDRLATEYGLQSIKPSFYQGMIHGYNTIIGYVQQTQRYHLRIGFGSENVDTKNLIADLLLVDQVASATVNNHMLFVTIKHSLGYEKVKTAVDTVTEKASQFFRSNNVSNGCMNCGSVESVSTYQFGDEDFLHLCSNCYAEVNQSLEREYEAKRQKPIRQLPGVIGALLGALIGAGIWAVVYRMGFVAWVVGFVIVVLSLKGYELLGGRIGKTGMIVGVLFAFAGVLFGNYLGWCWDIYEDVKMAYDVSFFDVFQVAISWIFDPSDNTALLAFIKNTSLGLLAVLIGGIPLAINSMKESSGRKEIKRIG